MELGWLAAGHRRRMVHLDDPERLCWLVDQ